MSEIDRSSTPSRTAIILAVGALAIGVALGATQVTDRSASASSATSRAQTSPVEIVWPSLKPMPEDLQVTDLSTDPAALTIAPDLIGTGVDGSVVHIGNDGRAKAIYFLAPWCSYCQEEVPAVQALIDSGAVPEGLDLYAVTTFDDPDADPSPAEWLREERFAAVAMRDDDRSSAMEAFAGPVVPYVVYLDAAHQVVGRSISNIPAEKTIELWQLAVTNNAD